MNYNREPEIGEKVLTQIGVGKLVKTIPHIFTSYDHSDYEGIMYLVLLENGKEIEVDSVWHKDRLFFEIKDSEDQLRRFNEALSMM